MLRKCTYLTISNRRKIFCCSVEFLVSISLCFYAFLTLILLIFMKCYRKIFGSSSLKIIGLLFIFFENIFNLRAVHIIPTHVTNREGSGLAEFATEIWFVYESQYSFSNLVY